MDSQEIYSLYSPTSKCHSPRYTVFTDPCFTNCYSGREREIAHAEELTKVYKKEIDNLRREIEKLKPAE